MAEAGTGAEATYRLIRLSEASPRERARLLKLYERGVYAPAFPDAELREDVAVWRRLLDEDPGPPQPRLDVILALGDDGAIVGGATVEHYRRADCGLLTYIAVAEGRRDGGIGRALVEESRRRLAEWAQRPVPLLAETERFEEARTGEERAEIALRQRRLARLGARALDFDYVMPPLRPGLPPRRLHLMAVGEEPGAAIPAATVVGLIEELAEALGADPRHEALVPMLARLRERETIGLVALPASESGRCFREAPAFPVFEAAALSFAFEVRFEEEAGEQGKRALRLERIEQAVEADAALHKALVEPVRSFLDDVTTGPPGRNGRPLLFAASDAPPDAPEREVRLIRPAFWTYEAEGESTGLLPAGGPGPIELRLQDAFCAFSSGRLFYVLTLATAPDALGLDEYALLQAEQLALDPHAHGSDESFLRFEWEGSGKEAGSSLLDLAEARLRSLEQAEAATGAFRGIIERFGIRSEGAQRRELGPEDLIGLCIAVESKPLLRAAKEAEELGSSKARMELDRAPEPGLPAHGDPANRTPRRLLAVSGLAQGVPDFPFQDQSEVFDSTRPVCSAADYTLYVHPRFMVEIGVGWRSFEQGRRCIGTCPYLLLMWIVALHDERMVTELEAEIDRSVYGGDETSLQAVPLRGLADGLRDARWLGADRGASAVELHLQSRLDMFRWLSIHRVGNLFRYQRERSALAEIQNAMGTSERFERCHQAIDRLESLVEDVATVQSGYAERRTNRILLAIALLSILSVSSDLSGLFEQPLRPWIFAAMVVVALAALAILYRRGRRLRKAGPGKSPSRTP